MLLALAIRPISCDVSYCSAVMSANEEKDAVFEAIKGGAEEYLIKPVTKKELQNIWRYVWKRVSATQLRRGQSEVSAGGCHDSSSSRSCSNAFV